MKKTRNGFAPAPRSVAQGHSANGSPGPRRGCAGESFFFGSPQKDCNFEWVPLEKKTAECYGNTNRAKNEARDEPGKNGITAIAREVEIGIAEGAVDKDRL